MKTALIFIGDELLKGATLNTNATFIGQKLLENGIVPVNALTVSDSHTEIKNAFEFAFREADTVITTGGLGPTRDDVTKCAAAEYFGMKLVKSEKAEEHLENCLRKLRRKNIPESVYNQIYVPEGCELMHNETGTALGILLRKKIMKKIKLLIMLPGPPREMKPMFLNHALPEIIKHSGPETHSIMFHLAGVPESEAEQKMIPLLEEGLKTAYCAEPGNVRVFLSSENFTLLENKVAEAKKIFGDSVLPADCESPVQHVIKLLTEMKCTLSTAESCTGGLISASFTDIPGASATYKGSMIAYHNECKERMLNVSRETLLCYGAVSAQCSSEMVEGVCDKLETEAGIAVTGIAGPGGGTTEKPVGLVYIAVKFKNKKVITENHFHGNRETVRFRTLSTAVNILRNMIISEKNKEQ